MGETKGKKNQLDFGKTVSRVSSVSIIGNMILTAVKLLAGVAAHSSAMISDAIHSASDVFSTIVVLIGVRFASKDSDDDHPYGHERMECVAAILLAVVLFITGVAIGYDALMKIISKDYKNLEAPGMLALAAAILSIVVKEAMFWYTRINAKRIDSTALMADAWHHRSDALSSVGALIGIGFARFGFPVMDPVASLVIFFFIAKAAFDIFRDAINKMVDHACDEKTQKEIYDYILKFDGVDEIDLLQTREFGSKIYVDLEIGVDSDKSLTQAHEIAETIHRNLEKQFPKVKHVMIHVNPVGAEKKEKME